MCSTVVSSSLSDGFEYNELLSRTWEEDGIDKEKYLRVKSMYSVGKTQASS